MQVPHFSAFPRVKTTLLRGNERCRPDQTPRYPAIGAVYRGRIGALWAGMVEEEWP